MASRFELLLEALDADRRFRTELVRVYGESRAGDMRYAATHQDAALDAAMVAKLNADKAYLDSELET